MNGASPSFFDRRSPHTCNSYISFFTSLVMKVCVGGTFDILHAGHVALLEKAFEIGDEVVVGLSSDELVQRSGKRAGNYQKRKEGLERFLRDRGWHASIEPIHDIYGTAMGEEFDAIVVSPETAVNAAKINEMRVRRGIKLLRIVEVPYVLAQDGIPLSTSRIKRGEIAGRKRILPLRVCIGSHNMVKREATEEIFNEVLGRPHDISITCALVDVEARMQPEGGQILEGALRRATAAAVHGDYGVGIEAGVREEQGIWFVEHYAAIVDSVGYVTYGKGPAFTCPQWLREHFCKDTEQAALFGNDNEREMGFVWQLSHHVERRHLIKEAVTMALLPRMVQK